MQHIKAEGINGGMGGGNLAAVMVKPCARNQQHITAEKKTTTQYSRGRIENGQDVASQAAPAGYSDEQNPEAQ